MVDEGVEKSQNLLSGEGGPGEGGPSHFSSFEIRQKIANNYFQECPIVRDRYIHQNMDPCEGI